MSDVTIVGGGGAANRCYEVLSRAGFSLTRAFELDPADKSPVVIGEVHGAFLIARQALEAGRHVLVASSQALSTERLAILLEERTRTQALFVWSERRFHPAYRFVAGLVEADATWEPRFMRQQVLSRQPAGGPLASHVLLESVGLACRLAAGQPERVWARSIESPRRNFADLLTLGIEFSGFEATLQVGFGEALDRRETLIAAEGRRAFIDEVDQTTPIRLIGEEADGGPAPGARWLACPAPRLEELARQQCIAFLEATLDEKAAEREAALWQRSVDILRAVERSSKLQGAPVAVETGAALHPRLRVVGGRAFRPVPPTAA
ncbi:MAG TPA: hypothetical protein VNN21_08805 [Dehalococcoidia bacterium]|nr:hypothetical protein [Dehalococcoidia bacterium]